MHHRKRLAQAFMATLGLGATLGLSPEVAGASVTVSPLRGTPTALPGTQISFLGAPAKALSSISVVGSASGRHRGRLRSYSSAPGASFLPSKPFTAGERVTVHARVTTSKHRHSTLSSTFTIAHPGVVSLSEFPPTPGTPADVQNFRSRPDLHPGTVTVHHPAGAGSAPGYLLAAPFLGPGQYGPMIFDNAGSLVWFRPLPDGQDAADLRTQLYHGKNDLTWWQGRTVQFGYGLGVGVIANANYKTVAVVKAGNGLAADEHEFLLTPQGSAYILAYNPVMTNLAGAGGPASGLALDGVIQQIDIHTGLVMWEWHCLGNVDVSESYSKVPGLATNPFDYFHINSLTTDAHGNLLISARNTWALYQINAHTGAVIWRLAGKKTTFKLGPGVAFAYQHNALWLAKDQISLFDDEGAPPVKPPSRGEIIKLDLKAKTATLAAQFVRSPAPLITNSQGNAQPLPGGGWMVGWGGLPNLTEFNARGEVLYDAQLPRGENSYRVYREPWSGQPTERPAIVARTTGAATAVYASWNGATTVASWQLLSGASATHLNPVSTTPKSGFETVIPAAAAPFLQVRALSASGKVLGTSKAVRPTSG
jgi:outer membrane protein assembly factor BamB